MRSHSLSFKNLVKLKKIIKKFPQVCERFKGTFNCLNEQQCQSNNNEGHQFIAFINEN